MNDYKKICLFVSMLIAVSPVIGQITPIRSCATTGLNTDKKTDSIQLSNESLLGKYLHENKLNTRNVMFIPLVFHVVYTDEKDKISPEQITKQIEVLNECFNTQNKDLAKVPARFRPFIGSSGFQFCLAYRDMGDSIKSAIEYLETDLDNIGEALNPEGKPVIKYSQLGGLDAWDTEQYVNIWIGDLSIYQGLTSLPGATVSEEEGIVIDPDFFGVYASDTEYFPYHLGKTLAHEMGHFFNLKHLWGDLENCDSDDMVKDTPPQDYIYSGCPSGDLFSCGSSDMYMNFMNFTDDECLLFFTKGQSERMRASIELFYPGIFSSSNCREMPVVDNPLDKLDIVYNSQSKTFIFERELPYCDPIEIMIYHIDGKLVLREMMQCENLEEINLNNLTTGFYILFLRTENNFLSKKIVVY